MNSTLEKETAQSQGKPTLSTLYWPILLVSLAFGIMSFLLPLYARAKNFSAVEIGGLFSIFSATTMIIRPLVGWGLDRIGRKPFLIGGMVGYGLTMGALAMAQTLGMFYLARAIQGLASSLMWVTAYTIATDLAPGEGRGRAVAHVDAASSQGALYGSFPGFFLVSMLPMETAWPILFGGYAAAALAAALLAWRSIPETRPPVPAHKIQALTKVSLDLYRLMAIVFLTGMASAMVAPIWLLMLQDHFTQDTRMIATAFIPAALVYSFLPVRLGRLSDRLGRAPMMSLGLAFAGLASLLLPALTQLPDGLWILVGLWVLEATGFVMTSPAQEALVADLTGQEERGRAYGLYTLAAGIGAAAGPLIGGWLYDSVNFAAPFLANGGVLIISAALVLILLGRYRR